MINQETVFNQDRMFSYDTADQNLDEASYARAGLYCSGSTYRFIPLHGEYKWTIFDLSVWTSKKGHVLKSPIFSVGKYEWKLLLFTPKPGYKEGVDLVIETDSLPNEDHVQAKIELHVSAHDQTLYDVVQGEMKFAESNRFFRFNQNIYADYYRQIELSETNDKVCPLVITCKISFLAEDVAHDRSQPEDDYMDCLQSPFFRLREFDGYKKLFDSEVGRSLSDCKIVCETMEFPAHKIVLATRCSHFLKLLTSECREAKENVITIEGVRQAVLYEILRFLYCVNVKNLKENAEEMLMAADRFGIDGLKDVCEKYFCQSLNEGNLAEYVRIANTYDARRLKRETNILIAANILKNLQGISVDALTTEQKYVLSQMPPLK